MTYINKLLPVVILLFSIALVAPAHASSFNGNAQWQSGLNNQSSLNGNRSSFHTNNRFEFRGFQNFRSDFAERQTQLQNRQDDLFARIQQQGQQTLRNIEQRHEQAFATIISRPITERPDWLENDSNVNGNNGENGNSNDNGDSNEHENDFNIPTECTATNLSEITNYPPPKGPVIAFGNSLTSGVGASAGQDFVSELERMSGRTIMNAGVPGDTTADALMRLHKDVLQYNPSSVIVFLGGNDLLIQYYERISRNTDEQILENLLERIVLRLFGVVPDGDVITEAETFNNLTTIVKEIQSTGAVVILVGVDGRPFGNNVSNEYRTVATETGAILVPNALNGIIGNPSRMSDLIHPNDRGYDILADRIYGALSCVL